MMGVVNGGTMDSGSAAGGDDSHCAAHTDCSMKAGPTSMFDAGAMMLRRGIGGGGGDFGPVGQNLSNLVRGGPAHMSIESAPFEKSNEPVCGAPLVAKPKVPLGPVPWPMPSSAVSSSSEKYFSMMLYALR
jgi:hypothetical protein